MNTEFTVIFKRGNVITDSGFKTYTTEAALAEFRTLEPSAYVLAIMPTSVFELLPDASVFFGIFPY